MHKIAVVATIGNSINVPIVPNIARASINILGGFKSSRFFKNTHNSVEFENNEKINTIMQNMDINLIF